MESNYHFPPDLFNLLVEAIPCINKTKKDLLSFFRNVGMPLIYVNKYVSVLSNNPSHISKKDITRQLLEILNSKSDKFLSIRRELLQRVIDFAAFDTCYPDDIDTAKARIYDIKSLVMLKDSITKQSQYLNNERIEKLKAKQQQLEKIAMAKSKYEALVRNFNSLFSINTPQRRWYLSRNR